MSETPPTASAPPAMQRLRRIEIRNYKAIDALDLDFPPPLMTGDPDITVVGSSNGVGKTSLLECCALAHLAVNDPITLDNMLSSEDFRDEWFQLIRAGQPHAVIKGYFGTTASTVLELHRSGRHQLDPPLKERYVPEPNIWNTLRSLFSRSANPMIWRDLLLFHSFRKIQEGPIPTSQLLAGEGEQDEQQEPISVVKRVVLTAMMGRAGLIENIPAADAGLRYEQFDALLETFAVCRLGKLRNLMGGDFELRVASPEGLNFTFDGLSSGQKEIVSTLFLIQDATRAKPGLILIDEPELHMNAEWQRIFVRELHKLAPHNQYILATHSEEVFASVEADHRVLLTRPRIDHGR